MTDFFPPTCPLYGGEFLSEALYALPSSAFLLLKTEWNPIRLIFKTVN